ncbi:putative metalloprotease CJM1_0395 family protein [Pelagicoccus sp. SDUM812002]|uniref:putative metalloprotease CJM1_0395 family protein n=1 Tax=Pelagicoccus sp. SDUM812002 TaxID=3041266 RepID=UPI00280FF990|nr:putative metalloprotease CJM1_0395 family protein [Pelagicoccus sp. SDUM812002]MDQ8186072.1 putative metalloprotease CJM1_0395 family protein [Pelagicoccus sp. SDUM812002]
MIGTISSVNFAYYGVQGNPRGDRGSASLGSDETAVAPQDTLESEKEKKQKEEKFSTPQKLTAAEKEQVEKLKQRDSEVRAHEQAHMAAAGSLALGGPNYVFQTGPDGRQYAIGGDVKIDTSPGRTPEETAQKAQQIRAAALAPADPSGQDLKVAAAASSMETEASSKLAGKNEKDSQKTGVQPDAEAKGEITSSRQVFAASPSDSNEGKNDDENADPRPNPYLALAGLLYGKQ